MANEADLRLLRPAPIGLPMTVAIVRATMDTVDQAMATAIQLLAYKPTKDAFFIKPNVADAGPVDQGILTHPRVVEAFLRLYPPQGRHRRKRHRGTRLALRPGEDRLPEMANRLGAELVDLEQAERFAAPWREGTIKLPTLIRTHEYINIAKMKTHVQAGVTLGMKNQKGLLHFADKKRFHMTGLDACIRQLGEIANRTSPSWTASSPWKVTVLGDLALARMRTCWWREPTWWRWTTSAWRLMGFPPDTLATYPTWTTWRRLAYRLRKRSHHSSTTTRATFATRTCMSTSPTRAPAATGHFMAP